MHGNSLPLAIARQQKEWVGWLWLIPFAVDFLPDQISRLGFLVS